MLNPKKKNVCFAKECTVCRVKHYYVGYVAVLPTFAATAVVTSVVSLLLLATRIVVLDLFRVLLIVHAC